MGGTWVDYRRSPPTDAETCAQAGEGREPMPFLGIPQGDIIP
jgi:hypothetical protein